MGFPPSSGLASVSLRRANTGLRLSRGEGRQHGYDHCPCTFQTIGTLPIAVWEFSLGVWLVVKGFNPSPITEDMVVDVRS
jgi:hypothetical protein